MSTYGIQTGVPQWVTGGNCYGGCPSDTCPDFVIKRHDTKPSFRVSLQDCTGAVADDLDSDYLLAEVSMWAKAKLKTAITAQDTYFAFADNIGFDQMLPGDILVMDRVRRPEQMKVLAFDETNKLVLVQRGFNNTDISAWPRGTLIKILRVKNATATVEKVYEDILQTDGTTAKDQLTGVYLVYDWQPNDTCLPGCYVLEFKLLQMVPPIPLNLEMSNLQIAQLSDISIVPSFTPSTMSIVDFGCVLGDDVEWVRRYPQTKDGFFVQVIDSPTSE